MLGRNSPYGACENWQDTISNLKCRTTEFVSKAGLGSFVPSEVCRVVMRPWSPMTQAMEGHASYLSFATVNFDSWMGILTVCLTALARTIATSLTSPIGGEQHRGWLPGKFTERRASHWGWLPVSWHGVWGMLVLQICRKTRTDANFYWVKVGNLFLCSKT